MFFPRMQFLRQLEILCPFNNVFVMLELHAFSLSNPLLHRGLHRGSNLRCHSGREKLRNLGVVGV